MSPKNRVQIVNNKMRHLFKITEFLTFHAEMKVATFLARTSSLVHSYLCTAKAWIHA